MKYRRFGRTGIEVSEVVIGAGWVGGILINQDPDTMREALRLAMDAGINWIDTAESYGDGVSETNVGWLLQELPPEGRPGVSTKARLDLESSETIGSQLDRKIDASLKRLRMDSVDVYQLHNPIKPEAAEQYIGVAQVLGAGGVADQLDRLREDGRIRHIGITALGAIDALTEVVASGRFDTAQIYYNMLNPSAAMPAGRLWNDHNFAGLIDACKAADMGMMDIRIFAAGVIATDVRHGREVRVTGGVGLDEETRRAHAVIAALGDGLGDRAQMALRFGLANPDLSCVVLGLAELDHLTTALAGVRMGPLPADAIARLDTLYDRNFAVNDDGL